MLRGNFCCSMSGVYLILLRVGQCGSSHVFTESLLTITELAAVQIHKTCFQVPGHVFASTQWWNLIRLDWLDKCNDVL